MKPSTKAKLAIYVNFVCFLVETAVGICTAILIGYELVLIFVGYFYEADKSNNLDDYGSASTAASIHQYPSAEPADSVKTVVRYDQELQRLKNDKAFLTSGK